LRREREHQLDHERFVEKHAQYHNTHDKQLLDALELGRPVILQGRRLEGWGIRGCRCSARMRFSGSRCHTMTVLCQRNRLKIGL
jgi:hypothetical protein